MKATLEQVFQTFSGCGTLCIGAFSKLVSFIIRIEIQRFFGW